MTKRTLTPDNLGSDFELDSTAQKIKVNIDDETIVRDGNGKLKVVVDIPEATPYNITTLPDGSIAPTTSHDTSVAIGVSAGASASRSTTVGNSAQATHVDSTALGSNSKTSKINQVSVAQLNTTTHLADTPRIVSGVASPVVDQDAANKEYVDNLTAVDGTTITRNAEGELVASGGGGGGDSVVYNITELPEGAEAPKANVSIIDAVTGESVEGPDPLGYVIAIGAGAEANGVVGKLSEGRGYVGVPSLAIGGSHVLDSGGFPQDVPASSGIGGIAIFGQAEGEVAVAIGNAAAATGASALAIGDAATATGYKGSIAIGVNSKSSDYSATAIGVNSKSSGYSATAIGSDSKAEGDQSIALGPVASASDYYSVAIGGESKASGWLSTTIGAEANASHTEATAIGRGAHTSRPGEVSIAHLDQETNLAVNPRFLSGVRTPAVGQDAANKDYVDDLTKVDGTTITRNAEGELHATGATEEYVDNYIKAKVEALPEDATLEDLITALKS